MHNYKEDVLNLSGYHAIILLTAQSHFDCPNITTIKILIPNNRPQEVKRTMPANIPSVQLTWKQAEQFLSALAERVKHKDTVTTYRRNLKQFYAYLPPDGRLESDSIVHWRDHLIASGYKPRSVNLRLSSVNSFLDYLDLRAYQIPHQIRELGDNPTNTLTRNDYLRMLLAAKKMGDERTYLLVKVFALIGLNLHELTSLTVEAVQQGSVTDSTGQIIRLPVSLQQELTHYCQSQRCTTGPIFLNKNGKPLNRSTITGKIQELGKTIGLPQAASNPRALRKLWQTTQEEMQAQVTLLVEQMQDRLLEQEQLTAGWTMQQKE